MTISTCLVPHSTDVKKNVEKCRQKHRVLETTWCARGSLQALNSRIIETLGAPLLQYQLIDPPAVGCPDHVHRGEEPRQVGGRGTKVQHLPDETTEHSSEFIKNQVSSEFINATIVMNNVIEAESGGCSNFFSATKTTLTLPPPTPFQSE